MFGFRGLAGLAGLLGFSGLAGFAGLLGFSGLAGFAGLLGFRGLAGFAGFDMLFGPYGPTLQTALPVQSAGLNGSGSAGSAFAKAGANSVNAINSAPVGIDPIIL
ncbi:hypothetical protein AN914_22770 [Mycobacteroides immunogenum]|nr:hypothetical protein AN914_22770 [Mycobacteroides immunogenum]